MPFIVAPAQLITIEELFALDDIRVVFRAVKQSNRRARAQGRPRDYARDEADNLAAGLLTVCTVSVPCGLWRVLPDRIARGTAGPTTDPARSRVATGTAPTGWAATTGTRPDPGAGPPAGRAA